MYRGEWSLDQMGSHDREGYIDVHNATQATTEGISDKPPKICTSISLGGKLEQNVEEGQG